MSGDNRTTASSPPEEEPQLARAADVNAPCQEDSGVVPDDDNDDDMADAGRGGGSSFVDGFVTWMRRAREAVPHPSNLLNRAPEEYEYYTLRDMIGLLRAYEADSVENRLRMAPDSRLRYVRRDDLWPAKIHRTAPVPVMPPVSRDGLDTLERTYGPPSSASATPTRTPAPETGTGTRVSSPPPSSNEEEEIAADHHPAAEQPPENSPSAPAVLPDAPSEAEVTDAGAADDDAAKDDGAPRVAEDPATAPTVTAPTVPTIPMRTRVVCVNVKALRARGIPNLEAWRRDGGGNGRRVYIGRRMRLGSAGGTAIFVDRSKWHNPFRVRKGDGGRAESIEKYRLHILEKIREDPETYDLAELRAAELGCWCKPRACHGDVLKELVDARFGDVRGDDDDSSDTDRVVVVPPTSAPSNSTDASPQPEPQTATPAVVVVASSSASVAAAATTTKKKKKKTKTKTKAPASSSSSASSGGKRKTTRTRRRKTAGITTIRGTATDDAMSTSPPAPSNSTATSSHKDDLSDKKRKKRATTKRTTTKRTTTKRTKSRTKTTKRTKSRTKTTKRRTGGKASTASTDVVVPPVAPTTNMTTVVSNGV